MKKLICLGFLLLSACLNQRDDAYDTVNVVNNFVVDDHSVPIFPKKAALTTDTARRFSLEIPADVVWIGITKMSCRFCQKNQLI